MRAIIVIANSILLATAAAAASDRAAPPNVLLIYTDDQGSIDLNCYGAKDLATPNLDRLASRGVRLPRCMLLRPSAQHLVPV